MKLIFENWRQFINEEKYKIKLGDNLWNLAREKGVKVQDLLKWNKNIEGKGSIIHPGMIINVSNPGRDAENAPEKTDLSGDPSSITEETERKIQRILIKNILKLYKTNHQKTFRRDVQNTVYHSEMVRSRPAAEGRLEWHESKAEESYDKLYFSSHDFSMNVFNSDYVLKKLTPDVISYLNQASKKPDLLKKLFVQALNQLTGYIKPDFSDSFAEMTAAPDLEKIYHEIVSLVDTVLDSPHLKQARSKAAQGPGQAKELVGVIKQLQKTPKMTTREFLSSTPVDI